MSDDPNLEPENYYDEYEYSDFSDYNYDEIENQITNLIISQRRSLLYQYFNLWHRKIDAEPKFVFADENGDSFTKKYEKAAKECQLFSFYRTNKEEFRIRSINALVAADHHASMRQSDSKSTYAILRREVFLKKHAFNGLRLWSLTSEAVVHSFATQNELILLRQYFKQWKQENLLRFLEKTKRSILIASEVKKQRDLKTKRSVFTALHEFSERSQGIQHFAFHEIYAKKKTDLFERWLLLIIYRQQQLDKNEHDDANNAHNFYDKKLLVRAMISLLENTSEQQIAALRTNLDVNLNYKINKNDFHF